MNARVPGVRPCHEAEFDSVDGTRLFYRYWPTEQPGCRRALVLFHRGHEHGARMAHLADELDMSDYNVFAWDARGLGRSSGERGYADSFGTLVKDVDVFIRHIAATYQIDVKDMAVIAQSVGAVAVAAWVHDYAPPIRCMVLASPAFKVKLYVPFARPFLSLLSKFRKKFYVNSYVKASFLTHDPERIASYRTDPLITRPIAVNVLLDLYSTAERIVADAAAITVPTQLLISGSDFVVHHGPQHAFMRELGSADKEVHVLDGFYHDTFGELARSQAIDKCRAFLARQFAARPELPDHSHADKSGNTKSEFDRLSRPPESLAARAYWRMARFWIALGGKFSTGIALGLKTGFDSGSTLDYVYCNRAQGATLLGKYIDRIYLDSIGWRGIRMRRHHLQRLIHSAVTRLTEEGMPVRVMDIAAGHGRYLLETLAPLRHRVEQIILRDYDARSADGAQRIVEHLGLQDLVRVVQGDAFDEAQLAATHPRPTLAVVSGLYELFPDNAPVQRSLAGLAASLGEGSYLIYTGQPWHPQLEMIARSLTSHRKGEPWVMRRRTQAEIDQLVAGAGFEKIDQLADEWGIFTVSLCRRTAANV